MWWTLLLLSCGDPVAEVPSLGFSGPSAVTVESQGTLVVDWPAATEAVDGYEVSVRVDGEPIVQATAGREARSYRLEVGEHAGDVEVWVHATRDAAADPGQGPLDVRLGPERLELLSAYPLEGLGDVHGEGDVLVAAGRTSGSSFFVFDVADPAAPVLLAEVVEQGFVKDVKLHDGMLYTQGECDDCADDEEAKAAYDGVGVRLFDLSDPTGPELLGQMQGSTLGEPYFSVHNVTYGAGHLYLSDNGLDAMPIVDVSDPTAPVEVARYTPPEGIVHDQTVVGDRAYVAYWRGFAVLDVSQPSEPVVLAEHSEPAMGAVHNAWPTEDGRHLLVSSELPGGAMYVFDIEDLDAIEQVALFEPFPTDTIHNIIVQGSYAFVSWYRQGLVVVDIADPTRPEVVGHFDTHRYEIEGHDPDPGWFLYAGAWGVWPRDDGLVAVGDMENGLFLFRFHPTRVRR